jgi:hypothetical protein
MNKKILYFIFVLFFSNYLSAFAQAANFSFNPQVDTMLSISTSTPPALVWVVDSQGRKTGADPTIPINPNGQQMANYPYGPLDGIPNSESEQQCINDSATGVGQSTTTWFINVKTTSTQTFTINDMGVSTGVSDLTIFGLFPGFRNKKSISLLVNAGSTHQIEVSFNPQQKNLLLTRVVEPGDLLNDVKTSCQLNLITSRHVCKHLEDKAEEIKDALTSNQNKRAEGLIYIFLHYLGDSRPIECSDEDDHDVIQQAALTILVEDAKALLKSIENAEGDRP